MQITNNYGAMPQKIKYGINFGNKSTNDKNAELKQDFEKKCKLYPEDTAYFDQLAKEINLPKSEQYKLKSIVGEHQLEDIVKNASRNNFYPGEEIIKHSEQYTKADLEELAKKGFRLNLHMHTTHSDGKMSVKSLLDQAAQYADIVSSKTGNDSSKPSFIIAITDHDTFEGAKEAVKIISSNPQKYKNLGVVLGAELSALYRNEKMLATPFAYELAAYSINPFDKQFNDFLAITRNSRIESSKQIIQNAKAKYPDMDFSYEEACQFTINPKKGIDGCLYTLANYFDEKGKQTGRKIDTQDLCYKYLPSNNRHIPGTVNNAEDLFTKIKNNGYGFLGVVHPAKIYLGDGRIQDSFIKECESKNKDTGRVIMETFMTHLKNVGGSKFNAIETNYQSYEGDLKDGNDILNGYAKENYEKQNTVDWIKQFREYAQRFNLLETGGLDTHSENPFLRK